MPRPWDGKKLIIQSKAFSGGNVRRACSYDGGNKTPDITIYNIPPETQRYEIRMVCFHNQEEEYPKSKVRLEDGTWVLPWIHWHIWLKAKDNRNRLISHIPSGIERKKVSVISIHNNSWGEMGYGGPRPPMNERHQYHLALFARGSHNKTLAVGEITGWFTRGLPQRLRK